MFGNKPTCSTCGKEISGNDMVYVKMRYPERKGMTEIKAYLNNEGTFICEECFEGKDSEKGKT
ncbi:Fe3+ hydroxamate ABC transporter substrate-binding protein [Bacillus sp. AFS015802]|uniref:Fe3+ hydroxamate ABC transporter substrate-binding protein n=1 Tax=Bacillus sp. AFS015802 TaxID=2033486 RepID=UPI000BF65AC6|nr:Fe3+ hydroxamate ABC transporter substrate-binding protein [Bacillus sp. AFS015802]PFA63070.1 Fe3+ hydroxamate ABC transporter substrate-binding protein [Bacillus sp. AFS015802]